MRNLVTAGLVAMSALALVGCSSSSSSSVREGGTHEVVYSITGDGASASSISYVTVSGADVSLVQAVDETVPWSATVMVPYGAFSVDILTLSGRLGETGTTITCDISVDGESVASETSTGPSAAVTCEGSN
jgi:uncharacterized protein YcfL